MNYEMRRISCKTLEDFCSKYLCKVAKKKIRQEILGKKYAGYHENFSEEMSFLAKQILKLLPPVKNVRIYSLMREERELTLGVKYNMKHSKKFEHFIEWQCLEETNKNQQETGIVKL